MSGILRIHDLLCKDKETLKKIHTNSLDLIEECGIRFHSKKAVKIWDGYGAIIDDDIIKIPGSIIESALSKAPGTFTLCARDAKYDLNLDSERTFYSQDGCAAFTIDFESGERRRSCKKDIATMALIADYLDTVDIISPTVSAQDVPVSGINVHELEACFSNSGKHVVTESVTTARGARSQIELAAVVAGDEDALRKRPIFSNFVCSVSPLSQDPGGIEAALEFASAGIPVGVYSMATAGVTSPVTLAGTLAVLNAEVISALALIQLAVPGAKVFYAGGPATIDLRTGSYTSSSPEAVWLRTMTAELARFYGLPSIVGAGATTAKAPGEQAAWENISSFIFPSLAGASFLFGLGLLDGSNLLTYEEIILDAECARLVRRMLEGVDFGEGAFALSLIKELGPGGVFLGERHTVDHMRQALSLPMLSDRESYEGWERNGKLSRIEIAKRKVEEILMKHAPLPLPEDIKKNMGDVVAAYSD